MQRIILIFAMALPLRLSMADPAANNAQIDPERQAIIELDRKYVEAFNNGDLDRLMSLYSDDTEYFTGDGFQLKGIRQVRDIFRNGFAAPVKPRLKLDVREIKLLSADHAVEKGTAVLTTGEEDIATDYIAEYVKRDGQWKLRKVQERDIPPAAVMLQGLAPLIGEWEDSGEGVTIKTSFRWTLNQAFMQREFSSTVGSKLDVQGFEHVGWDAQNQTIRSWYFDSMGGRGVSNWSRQRDGWMIQAQGFLPNGGTASATHFLKWIDYDHLEWKSTNRIIDGRPEPDITVKFSRKDSVSKDSNSKGRKP